MSESERVQRVGGSVVLFVRPTTSLRTLISPHPTSLFHRQTYDSRRESPGWSQANFSDPLYAWVPVQIMPPPGELDRILCFWQVCRDIELANAHTDILAVNDPDIHTLTFTRTLTLTHSYIGGVLVPQSFPPIRIQQTLRYVRHTNPALNVDVFDFGQNMAGIVKVDTHSLTHACIHIHKITQTF